MWTRIVNRGAKEETVMRRKALGVLVILVGLVASARATVILPNGDPDPAQANLRLWLKADAGITTPGGAVSAWNDQSAAGNHFAQGTLGNQPTHVLSVPGLNNKPAVRFNGSTARLDGPASVYNAATSTTFLVMQAANPGSNNYRFIYDTAGTRYEVNLDNRSAPNQGWSFDATGGRIRNLNIFPYDGRYVLGAAVVRGSNSFTELDGTGRVIGTTNGGVNGSPFRLGARYASPAAGNHYNGDLAELLIYNRVLDERELHEVGYYLEQKYGLSTAYAPPITDVGSTASSQLKTSTFNRRTVYAVNGNGLNAAGEHNNLTETYTWLSDLGDKTGFFVVDLKDIYNLSQMKVWNYNEVGAATTRGVQTADILVSIDGLTFTPVISGQSFTQAPGTNNYRTPDGVDFAAGTRARYIKLDITANHGDANYSGLSEVQVFGTFALDAEHKLGGQYAVAAATASTQYPGRLAIEAADGTGLGDPDFDGRLEHNTADGDGWLTTANDPNPWIQFDLGFVRGLGAMKVWNYNELGANDYLQRGVRTLDVLISTDGSIFNLLLDDIELLPAPSDGDYDFPQIVDLMGALARYVRLDISQNWGDANHTGLAEVQFFDAPEPTTMALLGLGGLGMLARRRRKR